MIQKRATSVAFFILLLFVLGHIGIGLASDAVYKCGDIFTNDTALAKREKCTLLEGGSVVTIPAPTQQKAVTVTPRRSTDLSKAGTLKSQPVKPQSKFRSAEQQARDSDSKAIIQSELKKTEVQLVDLRKQYATLSSQQDLERKLEIKQKIARAEADVVSLKRELRQEGQR
ncbi:MAG: hypothetical protein RLY82_628 [Pseudomonadota bacterium]|jgi:hypothetical protein